MDKNSTGAHEEEFTLFGFGSEPCGCNLEPDSLREGSEGGYEILCKNGYEIPQDDYLMPLMLNRSKALSGIPDEWLPDVKKALLFTKLAMLEWFKGDFAIVVETSIASEMVDYVILRARQLRSRGVDFGELNTMIDSVGE